MPCHDTDCIGRTKRNFFVFDVVVANCCFVSDVMMKAFLRSGAQNWQNAETTESVGSKTHSGIVLWWCERVSNERAAAAAALLCGRSYSASPSWIWWNPRWWTHTLYVFTSSNNLFLISRFFAKTVPSSHGTPHSRKKKLKLSRSSNFFTVPISLSIYHCVTQSNAIHDAFDNKFFFLSLGLALHNYWCERPSFEIHQKCQLVIKLMHKKNTSTLYPPPNLHPIHPKKYLNNWLTLMLTHERILLESGSLSAAAVAKIGTHSESGARHKRHPPLRAILFNKSSVILKWFYTRKKIFYIFSVVFFFATNSSHFTKHTKWKKNSVLQSIFSFFVENFGFGLDHFPKMTIGTFRVIRSQSEIIFDVHTFADYTLWWMNYTKKKLLWVFFRAGLRF